MAKAKEERRYRSVDDLGPFEDFTNTGLESPTDPSDDEPIEQVVARMLRGDFRPGDGLGGSFDGEMDSDADVEAAMDSQPVYERDGFELADVARVQADAAEVLAGLPRKAKQKEGGSAESSGAAGGTSPKSQQVDPAEANGGVASATAILEEK